MDLLIAGDKINSSITGRREVTSAHSGKALQVFDVEFETEDSVLKERISKFLRQPNSEVISNGTSFKILRSSHSFEPRYDLTRFALTIEEKEKLNPHTVVLDGSLELTPIRYVERLDDGAIVIQMIARTSGEETATLERMIQRRGYFPVISHGVRSNPLQMRFGRCLWQDEDGGSLSHMLVLVQDAHDQSGKQSFRGFNEPELSRALDAIVVLQQLVDQLISKLVEKDVLDSSEALKLRKAAEEVVPDQLRQFDRAKDLNELFVESLT